jgi:DNA-binding SARP family transcriptional activator
MRRTGAVKSAETPAHVCLFGKPALFVEGRLRPFGGPRRAIALLAYVLLHRERSLSRASVAELFWPDEEDESARASLRRHLHRALSALPEADPQRPWLIADKVTLRWNPDAPLVLDTADYERLSAAGELDAAVELYRGDYLEDFHDDWALQERERLRSLQAANLVALVERGRRALDYSGAIAYAQVLLRLDPLREDAIRRIMSLRFAAGDRSGALAEFDAFRRRLHEELAADPMPETFALLEGIRSNDHATVEAGTAATDVRTVRPAFPFIGREAALAAMRRAWESAARGAAVTAIVTGEAGIGKSRLIGEVMALVEAQGGRVMFGTTRTTETEPYQAIAEALRNALALLQIDRLETVQLAAMSSLAPSVRDAAPNLPRLPALEPEADRQRLFDAVAAAFQQIAKKRPLLVVLEDLHWAGSATVELLEYLVQNVRGVSMLLVTSFREEEVDPNHPLRLFLRRLDAAHPRYVALGPLAAEDVRALVVQAAPAQGEQLAHDIFTASQGNALFATELLRDRLSGTGGEALPGGIAATVAARVERLTLSARSLAETAAVTGVGFELEVVRQASGWSFAEVFDALDELLDRSLVRESPQHRGDFAFSHQLVHAAVYAAIDEPARRGLHRRIGRTLQTLFNDRPSLDATIARHYDAAGLTEDAIARYLSSARYALAVFAADDAIAAASRALELGPNERDRFELHRLREEAASRAGAASLRRSDCAAMTEVARILEDDDLLGIALSRTIKLCIQVADLEGAAGAIDGLRTLGAGAASPHWTVEAAVAQARFAVNGSNPEGAEAVLHDAESLIATLGDDALAFEYWAQRAFNAMWTDLAAARTYIACARRHVGEDRLLAARALRLEANAADVEGNGQALRAAATELLEIYRETGDLEGQATAHRNLASAAWYLFDLAVERDHADHAIALFERIQKPNAVAAIYCHRGNSAIRFGDFARAEADFSRARSMWEAIPVPGNASNATRCLSNLAWFRGDHARCRELAIEALTVAREHSLEREEMAALNQLGVAERELGLSEPAREHLEASLQWYRDRDPRQVLEGLIELIPLYAALGESDHAVAAADELLEGLARDITCVTFPAQAFSAASAAYAAAGDLDRSHALKAQARVLAYELAARIDDEPSRRGYLGLPVHRAIFADDPPPGAVDGAETVAG